MMRKATALLCLLLLSISLAQAGQSASATLSGRVTDPQGAVIEDARVTLTQKSTGVQRQTETNGQGLYVLTNLAPGDYDLQITSQGFRTKSATDITLRVGQSSTLDVAMEVGEVAAETTVFLDRPPLIARTTSNVDGVINSREIQSLPLNGRNYLELALLIPGNSPAPNFDPTKTNSITISSAGQLGRGGSYTVDGADNNDDVVGGPLQNISADAVQEFQLAQRFSAEQGRSGSSIINVVTRAGSTQLHGSASFFMRDRRLQGLPATFDRANEEPPFDRQQYSFALGGPLVQNRAFWFGSFEYRNQDGAVLVGERDTAARTIRRSFAPAPLNDLMGTARIDWDMTLDDRLTFRYSIERADDITASSLIRPIGSASERQASENRFHTVLANYTRLFSPTTVNSFSFSFNKFYNRTDPVTPGPQLTYPSLQDGASFRVPQQTRQRRLQFTDTISWVKGRHTLRVGGDLQRVDGDFYLDVFREGRIELVQDFADFDHNGDGRVDDNDLLFAVTLRSAFPDRTLTLTDCDNYHIAAFIQDNWRLHPRLTLNLGLRYELDTDVKNVSRTDELNPLILPFLSGSRERDKNNFGPRLGFNWTNGGANTSVHGGYGIYYDRITLQIQSLERGLDGRALPVEVRAGNLFFLDQNTGRFPPFAPTISNPFTGFILPGAGAGGINIIDNRMQNPMVQQMNIGVERIFGQDFVARVDYLHNLGTHFIIGRTIGTVFNPVVGGPDRVVNLESSVRTKYDGLLASFEKRFSKGYQFRLSYTLSKSFNYANDDQIPFSNGPLDPENLRLEYGPTPNDQRHRFTFSGAFDAWGGFRLSPIWTLASGVPMDIILPEGTSRVPLLQRNAGGRLFDTGAELNEFIRRVNAGGGINGNPLPLVNDDARFNDTFNSFDLRVSRPIRLTEAVSIEPIVEVFNLFNVTNVLGVSNVNYSGFANTLVRDSNDPASPGFLRSSGFGQAVTTAGGVFGSGGPRAFQFAVRFSF